MLPYGILWLGNMNYHFLFKNAHGELLVLMGIGQDSYYPYIPQQGDFIKTYDWSC